MIMLPEYEIHAIRYATRDAIRREHFIGGDPHESPMPMDYLVWVITGPAGSIVMDLGFTAEMAKQRKRTFLRCPIESLKLVGVDARDVDDVIVSHMHYDHAGNLGAFPKARFHIQAREMAYATGKYMRYPRIGHSYHKQLDGPNGIIISRDDIINAIWIAVGVDNTNDRNSQLVGFTDRDALMVYIHHKQRIW